MQTQTKKTTKTTHRKNNKKAIQSNTKPETKQSKSYTIT